MDNDQAFRDQQTFSRTHWDEMMEALSMLDLSTLELLYRGSHSATFAPDFRAAIRETAQPAIVESWEA